LTNRFFELRLHGFDKEDRMSTVNKKKKSPAVLEQFAQYTRNISEYAIETHGGSYQTYQELRNSWRTSFDYSPKIEEDIIRATKFYIRMLNLPDARATDPNFLYSLIELIADFLSGYTARKNPDMSRHQEYKQLIQILWDKNPYITGLLARQARKRFAVSSKAKRTDTPNQEHIAHAAHKYEKNKEVICGVVAVSLYRKK